MAAGGSAESVRGTMVRNHGTPRVPGLGTRNSVLVVRVFSINGLQEDRRMAASRKDWNTGIIDEFRANQGKVGGMFEHTPILLLHHTGAKSGTVRVNPLAYRKDGD